MIAFPVAFWTKKQGIVSMHISMIKHVYIYIYTYSFILHMYINICAHIFHYIPTVFRYDVSMYAQLSMEGMQVLTRFNSAFSVEMMHLFKGTTQCI